MARLQLVQNAAARIILGGRGRDHVAPLLKELHWIPLAKRYTFKLLLLVFKAMHGEGFSCLSDHLISRIRVRYDRFFLQVSVISSMDSYSLALSNL